MAGRAVAAPSAGCGTAPPERPPEQIEVAGRERQAIVVVPEDYRPDRPHALVFAFHGRTNANDEVRRYFGLEAAAEEPTIFVYPAGLSDESGRFTWSDPGDPPAALRDFALFDALMERLSATYCIDRERIFVVGHSLGATFANSLACARGERIKGLAAVAGGINPADCSGEVAAILLHHPEDQAVPLREGARARDVLLGEPGEAAEPVNTSFAGFPCQLYGLGDEPLLWCLHDDSTTPRGRYYPHQWPEGAAATIMRFFARGPG